jgi:hypothetical protein
MPKDHGALDVRVVKEGWAYILKQVPQCPGAFFPASESFYSENSKRPAEIKNENP